MRFGELDLFERMTDYEIVGMSLLLWVIINVILEGRTVES